MKRLAALFLSIFILISSLSSCAGEKSRPSCRELLLAMTSAEVSLPAGRYYRSGAEEGKDEYLSESLLSALFGGNAFRTHREDWLDLAIFLSLGESPCEFAVAFCRNRDAAEDTAKLFSLRLTAIKTTKTAPEYKEMIENAKITVIGNYAVFIISTDSETALKIFKKTLK